MAPSMPSAIRSCLVGAVLLAATQAPARNLGDHVLSPAQLLTGVDALVDGAIDDRGQLLACFPADAQVQMVLPVAWEKGRATLAAILWASGFPAPYVRAVSARMTATELDKATPALSGSCSDPAHALLRQWLGPDHWASQFKQVFTDIGMAVPDTLPTADQWTKVKAVFAREAPAEAKMLNCIAVQQPTVLLFVMDDWAKEVETARGVLEASGFPRDDISELIAAAEPTSLLVKAQDRAKARAECEKDEDWKKRFTTFAAFALPGEIGEIIGGKR